MLEYRINKKMEWCVCFLFVGANSFKEAMRMGAEIYQNLKSVIKKKYGQDGKMIYSLKVDLQNPMPLCQIADFNWLDLMLLNRFIATLNLDLSLSI